ncbi:MAG: hypothetical protein AAGF75_01540 [Cyanobacteria bacterium P01_H01_bin.130]
MPKRLIASSAIALSLVAGLVLLPDRRSPELENYARTRYRPHYNIHHRGSGRRHIITAIALG